jgi:diguanylate cyclase
LFKLAFIFVVALAFPVLEGQANSSLILQQADAVRSSDPTLSKSLLASLATEKLTDKELDLFIYLAAYNLSMSGQTQESIENFESLTTQNTFKDIRQRSFASLVTLYAATGMWQAGIQIANQLLDELKLITEPTVLELANLSITVFYNLLGEHQLAMQHALKLVNSKSSPRIICTAYLELLYSQVKLSPQSMSQNDFDQAVDRCQLANEPVLIYSIYIHQTEYFTKTQQARQALDLLESKVSEVEATGYQLMVAAYYEMLAEVYLDDKQYAHAELYANKLLDSATEHQNASTLTTAYKVLSLSAAKRGDYQQAYEFQSSYMQASQLNLDEEHAKLLAIQNAKLNNIEKTNQIALLDKENALLDKQNALLKTQSALDKESAENDRLAMALLGLVLILLFFWAYKNRRMHKKLRKLAETDELTGISNRHHFSQLAHAAISYSEKSQQSLSFILLDLDFFKKINDNFGHQVGDWALKQAVIAARSVCRNNDVIGRMGGEEFAILLPGCSIDKAMALAESCRSAIAAVDSSESGHTFNITASFGVADTDCCGYDFDKLFAAADSALYQSKDMGRNKVYCYQHDQFTLAIS